MNNSGSGNSENIDAIPLENMSFPEQFSTQSQNLIDLVETRRDDCTKLMTELQSKESELIALKSVLSEKDEQNLSLQCKINQLEVDLKKSRLDLSQKSRDLQAATGEVKRGRESIKEIQAKNRSLEGETTKYKTENHNLNTIIHELNTRISELNKRALNDRHSHKLLQDERKKLKSCNSSLRNELNKVQCANEGNKKAITELKTQYQTKVTEIGILKNDYKAKIERYEDELTVLQSRNSQLKNINIELKHTVENFKRSVKELQEKHDAAAKEVATLKTQKQRHMEMNRETEKRVIELGKQHTAQLKENTVLIEQNVKLNEILKNIHELAHPIINMPKENPIGNTMQPGICGMESEGETFHGLHTERQSGSNAALLVPCMPSGSKRQGIPSRQFAAKRPCCGDGNSFDN